MLRNFCQGNYHKKLSRKSKIRLTSEAAGFFAKIDKFVTKWDLTHVIPNILMLS